LPTFPSEKKVSWWQVRTAEEKKVNCWKWTVLSMKNRSLQFIAPIAEHSVATSDDKH
jgi:hypothetical protein